VSRRSRPGLGSVLNFTSPGKAEGKTWFRFENIENADSSDCTDLYIYDEIGGWGVYSTDLIRELMRVTTAKVRVRINSPGGDVFEGLAIHNALSVLPAEVETYVEGHAASAANFIALAGTTRTYAKYSMGMAHNPSSGMWGEADDLRKMADLLDKVRDQLVKLYSDATGLDRDEWEALLRAETWFTAEEAVEFGLATRIDESAEKVTNAWDYSKVYNYAGRDKAPAPRHKVTNSARATPPAKIYPVVGEAGPELVYPLAENPLAPVPAPSTAVPSSQDETGTQEREPDQGALFDAEAFRVAMQIAVNPAVPTDQAPFEWDPEVFKAIMKDKTLTAPAVVSKPVAAPAPTEIKDLFDPDLFRQAVIEGVTK
jgi:ATP-dependent protease ClpP protease subunit